MREINNFGQKTKEIHSKLINKLWDNSDTNLIDPTDMVETIEVIQKYVGSFAVFKEAYVAYKKDQSSDMESRLKEHYSNGLFNRTNKLGDVIIKLYDRKIYMSTCLLTEGKINREEYERLSLDSKEKEIKLFSRDITFLESRYELIKNKSEDNSEDYNPLKDYFLLKSDGIKRRDFSEFNPLEHELKDDISYDNQLLDFNGMKNSLN